jgi:predicted MFS family arabinose efflux permease
VEWAAIGVVGTALVGYASSQSVPPAPPLVRPSRSTSTSDPLVGDAGAQHDADRRVFLAIMAISFFWSIGAILFIEFPPLAKNVLGASKEVASLFLVIFSVGVAIGSMSINGLLKGRVSARYSPVSVLVMSAFIVGFEQACVLWRRPRMAC